VKAGIPALEPWYEERMTSRASWGALESRIEGELILPASPDFDVAYRALNARFDDARPQAVVRCASPDDVTELIRFAGMRGMEIGTRGGGHCFGGRSSSRGLLVDVTPMHSVKVAGGAVTVGGGTRLGEVYESLIQHDLAIPAGSCPSVGVAGLALGGGLGIVGRKHGLTSDHLLGAQIVLADGRFVDCDGRHEGDLFWALRGAGAGNFGVVTSLTFRTIPAPTATNFHLAWPFSQAGVVIDAWQSWAPAAPEELAASLLIGASADIEEPPSAGVFGVLLGAESEATELVEELVNRAGSDPDVVFLRHMSFEETTRYWGEQAAREPAEKEPPGWELRGHRFIKSEFFQRPLSTEVIDGLLQNLQRDRVAGQSRELDFSPWGGGYNRVSEDATAFVHRDDRFWLKHATEVAPGAPAAAKEAAHDWITRSWGTVHPSGTGRVFPNFPDPDLKDWPRAYYGTNLERLLSIKARYDPGNLFRFRQSLPVRSR
jgi:FAD/FMN-containing dehydrogenase